MGAGVGADFTGDAPVAADRERVSVAAVVGIAPSRSRSSAMVMASSRVPALMCSASEWSEHVLLRHFTGCPLYRPRVATCQQ